MFVPNYVAVVVIIAFAIEESWAQTTEPIISLNELQLAVGEVHGINQNWALDQYQGQPVQWGLWGSWSTCQGTCGVGIERRQRACYGFGRSLVPLDNPNAASNPALRQGQLPVGLQTSGCFGYVIEARGCQLQPCQRQPVYGEWGSWTVCTAACGGGSQTRVRACLSASTCVPQQLTEIMPCNTAACVARWGPWAVWGACTASCGSGNQFRSRSCAVGNCPTNGARDTRQCNLGPCPALWSTWGPWGQCSASCSGGSQFRIRTCASGVCPPVGNAESRDCNTNPCGPSYLWGTWGNWGACSTTCGAGIQTKTRPCISGSCPSNEGSEITACNQGPCFVVPEWNPWGQWGICTLECGGGTQSRSRSCSQGNCPTAGRTETRICNTQSCAGIWSQWSGFSICSTSCGPGSRARTRVCIGSRNCVGDGTEVVTCNLGQCAGKWGDWGIWSICTLECGGGTRSRSRSCGGSNCPGDAVQVESCNTQSCTVYGWGEWQAFGDCSASCGQGTYSRSRMCYANNVMSSDQSPCLAQGGSATETQVCFGPQCYSFGAWISWSACTATCGQGSQIRTRDCYANGSPVNLQSGQSCGSLVGDLVETRACVRDTCYAWSQWSSASCSVTCGTGSASRSRRCTSADGRTAPDSMCPRADDTGSIMILPCEMMPCISWGPYGDYSACSATCGDGSQLRQRQCLSNGQSAPLSACSGLGGSALDQRSCNRGSCYAWSAWTAYSTCPVPCGIGQVTRTRKCVAEDGTEASTPSACGDIQGGYQSQTCNAGPCYSYGIWSTWSLCSQSCGSGTTTRSRSCLADGNPISHSLGVCGSLSGSLIESKDCSLRPCCRWTAWSTYSACPVSCGIGQVSRTRSCVSLSGAPVATCVGACGPNALETQTCNAGPCYAWSTWSAYSACPVPCGIGQISRTRRCVAGDGTEAQNPAACGSIQGGFQSQSCNAGPCYAWSTWSAYSVCPVPCGAGQITRTRKCVSGDGEEAPSSAVCGDAQGGYQSQPCDAGPCYSWQPWSQASCSVTCGTGVVTRRRRCATKDGQTAPNDSLCPSDGSGSASSVPCRQAPCYSWTAWSSYSPCSSSCSTGERTRTRRCSDGVNYPPLSQCISTLRGPAQQRIPCSGGPCYVVGEWGSWGQCSSSCGRGVIRRSRTCRTSSGVPAPTSACSSLGADLVLEGTCTRPACEGAYGLWGVWGPCSRSCNSGTRERKRVCPTASCPGVDKELQICNSFPCSSEPSSAVWSPWSAWSPCTDPCGGTRNMTRVCIGGKYPSDCGKEEYIRTLKCENCGPIVTFPPELCIVPTNRKTICGSVIISEQDCRQLGCCYAVTAEFPPCYNRNGA